MRTAFLNTLEKLAAEDPRVFLVVGDLGFTVVEPFARRFPRQFLNAGVAEQNMTGVAAGLALSGKIVFTYSIANFNTLRPFEQIRNDVCYHRANVKVVSVGGGLAYGSLGSSHHATEDLAVLRALPEMTVVAPGDPVEAAHATQAVARHPGPCYLRLGKAGEPVVHRNPIDFQLGRAITLLTGSDLTVISIGGMLESCLASVNRLRASGLSVGLVSLHTLKPLDVEAIDRIASESGAVLTVEEHSVVGGLGGAVAEMISQRMDRHVPFRALGLPDTFCRRVGGQSFLRGSLGLSVADIVRAGEDLARNGIRSRDVNIGKGTDEGTGKTEPYLEASGDSIQH
jgi:transketolase